MFLLCSLAECGQQSGVDGEVETPFMPEWQLCNVLAICIFAFSMVAWERYYSKLQKIL